MQINVPTSSASSDFLSVSYSSEFNVVALAQNGLGSIVVRSVDNGLTWVTSTYSGGSFGFIYEIASRTLGNTVYYLGADEVGAVYRSVDGGITWTNVASIPFSGYAVTIGTNGNAFIAGSSYRISSSSNATGYVTWTARNPATITPTSIWYDISTYNGVKVIAVAQRGNIYYSTNAGSSWTRSTVGVPSTAVIVYCVDHGSTNVAMVRVPHSFFTFLISFMLKFNCPTLKAGGASGYLALTTDAGVTWTGVSPFASSVVIRYHSIRMRSSTEAYVAGSDGRIYATFNAGTTWTLLASTGVTLYSLDVFSETQGTAGAVAGSQVYTIVSGTICLH